MSAFDQISEKTTRVNEETIVPILDDTLITDAKCLAIIGNLKYQEYFKKSYQTAISNLEQGRPRLAISMLSTMLLRLKRVGENNKEIKINEKVDIENFIERQINSLKKNGDETMLGFYRETVREISGAERLGNGTSLTSTKNKLEEWQSIQAPPSSPSPTAGRRRFLGAIFGNWFKAKPKEVTIDQQPSILSLSKLKNRLGFGLTVLGSLGLSILAGNSFFKNTNNKKSVGDIADGRTTISTTASTDTDYKSEADKLGYDAGANIFTIKKQSPTSEQPNIENDTRKPVPKTGIEERIYKIQPGDGWEKIIKEESQALKNLPTKVQENAIYNLLAIKAGKQLLGDATISKTININDIDNMLKKLTITRENGTSENLIERAERLYKAGKLN